MSSASRKVIADLQRGIAFRREDCEHFEPPMGGLAFGRTGGVGNREETWDYHANSRPPGSRNSVRDGHNSFVLRRLYARTARRAARPAVKRAGSSRERG